MLFSAVRSLSRLTPLSCVSTTILPALSTTISGCHPFLEVVRYRSNRSRRGLYDGKDVRSGNNVSHSKRRTKRTFKPNVFLKRVYSEILDEMIRFHLTAATLRTIDKFGGLDIYLLKSKHVTEGEGLVVKNRILQRLEELAAEERESVANKDTNKE